jgi:hypothetical protein
LENLRTLEKLGRGLTNERKVLRGVSEGYWLGAFENFRKTGIRAAASFAGSI